MSFNLVDLVKDQISDQLLDTMGTVLGTQGSQTTGALSGALPGLLSGLMNSASQPAGASALFDAVQKQDASTLDNIHNLLGSDQASAVASQGTSLLGSLLGSGALGQLAGVIANFAGISRGNSSSLMGMLAPIIIGVIKNKVMDGGMNANSLASLLTEQKDTINAAMPQGFSDQLQSAGFFDSIAPEPITPPPAAQPARATAPAPATATASASDPAPASSGSFMKWLLPLAAVVVLGWFGMQYLGKDAATDAVNEVSGAAQGVAGNASQAASAASADALQAAQAAMPAGVDLSKISENLEGVFGSTTDALTGITDTGSARAALPALEEASEKLDGLQGLILRLPDAAKGPIGSIVGNGIAAIQPLVDKVSAIPGVGSVIEPVVGPMLETLQGLAG
ncbi:MAG: DUF937 domain-containing protein [Granulosicoccus sp.]|nr:DUF937 domain-containing protein [Granulosicoccus sp.]